MYLSDYVTNIALNNRVFYFWFEDIKHSLKYILIFMTPNLICLHILTIYLTNLLSYTYFSFPSVGHKKELGELRF